MAKTLVLKEGEVDTSGIVSINRQSISDKLHAYMKKPASFTLFILICLATALSAGAVLWVLLYTLIQGVPSLRPDLFAWEWTMDNYSMMPALINTLTVAGLSLLIAGVIGIFAAIFMVEYAKSTNVFVKIVRVAAETLTGIPSIVFGIFGMIMFVYSGFRWGFTLLGGALTMAMMIMPTIMRTTEEALKAVPDSFREGSFALGAGKLRTIFVIILPSAMPGIISGVILGLGRVVGETMALVFTAGSPFNASTASGLMEMGSTLTVYMYSLINEGNQHADVAWAIAVVLIVLVVLINAAAEYIGNKLKKED